MKNKNSITIKGQNHNIAMFNIILWLCSYIILIFSFSQNETPTKVDYIYTISFLFTIAIPVLINLYILVPLFLKNEKYALFTFTFVINLIIFSQLNVLFFNYFIDYIFPEYYFISYHSNTKLITIFSVFLLSTTLIKLAEDWFYYNRNENRRLETEKQNILNQLTTLKSQINPHFLFNSLNVIYSLALDKKEETTKAIIQLSDILRYVIYDSNTKRVSLKNEIILLNNYIEFQKFRHQEKKIKFTHKINNVAYPIYPMLLLPLLENSFKHGIKGAISNTFININIEQKNNEFNFFIENNIDKNALNDHKTYSGLGIKNIENNLKIVYPNKHIFKISKTENKFKVTLKLYLNDD